MSRALLDVNVLIALLDQAHADHGRARDWISAEIRHGWASCAITQNGFVRILSQPRYPNSVSATNAIDLLRRAAGTIHHEFWPSSVSLVDPDLVNARHVMGSRQVTDVYLLALATQHRGRLVTFDRGISLGAVRGADESNLVVL